MKDAILPGATVGILGGGQLGRMMAMAARSLGYRVQVMDPDPSCPARFVVDACFEGSWRDARVAGDLARGCDVVTLEIEQISEACLDAAHQFAPVRPGVDVMRIVRDRIAQKNWLREHDFPLGAYRAIRSVEDVRDAAVALGPDIYLKNAQGGYDGRSQIHVYPASESTLSDAWRSLGSEACIAEKSISIEVEISILVARSPNGEIKVFPTARNHHVDQVLAWSVIPSSVSADLESSAEEIAVRMAELLNLEGILAIEMFVTRQEELLVNELAPRPHNSYHASERACATSQFEQVIRAICGLPLGDVEILKPAAIGNILGDLWTERQPRFEKALAVPGVHLHLYEKHIPRKGRKMGHLSASGSTEEQAVERVLTAMAEL